MRPSSAKAKGRGAQQRVRDALLSAFPSLEQGDIRSTSMGASGEDLLLSPAARKLIPYTFEIKQVEKINIWEAISQAEAHAAIEGVPGVVVFGRNRTVPYVALSLNEFIKLVSK